MGGAVLSFPLFQLKLICTVCFWTGTRLITFKRNNVYDTFSVCLFAC